MKKKIFNCLSYVKFLYKRKMYISLFVCLGLDNVKLNIYVCINFFLNELYVY